MGERIRRDESGTQASNVHVRASSGCSVGTHTIPPWNRNKEKALVWEIRLDVSCSNLVNSRTERESKGDAHGWAMPGVLISCKPRCPCVFGPFLGALHLFIERETTALECYDIYVLVRSEYIRGK